MGALLSTRRPALALGIGLDLLLAAGLLRLATAPSWRQIAATAAIVALRHLIGRGLRAGAPVWRRPGPRSAARTPPPPAAGRSGSPARR
ncbi:DUF1622 domain-containing protein [Kineococcus xinjiangensis]|uniref:DUF1622 domain-containing protein n=1 Tax=Kineococcus xinjiangensis TaxID=512762 RepID=UPI0031845EB8